MKRTSKMAFFSGLRLPVVVCSMLFSLPVTAATIDFEQKPLLVNDPLPPNIMFILDDSGSMYQDDMPDDTNCSDAYDTSARVINYSSGKLNDEDRERCESSDYNKIYFNPNANYPAPVDALGNSLGDIDFYNAKIDGFGSYSSRSVDLSKWVQERVDEKVVKYEWQRQRTGTYCEVAPTNDDRYCPPGNIKYDGDRDRNRRWWQVESTERKYYDKPFRYFLYNSKKSGCDGRRDNDQCYDLIYVDLNDAAMKQKVANWYSYYRTRMMLAKSGVSLAFDELKNNYRIGYGSINADDTIRGSDTIVARVERYETARGDFYSWLLSRNPQRAGTPLRRALGDAGEYFSSEHPYRTVLSDKDEGELSCRQNFTVLMTDGYWNSASASNADAASENDNAYGSVIKGIGGNEYQYKPEYPFKSSATDNLADIAMYYWKNDLRPLMKNDVPTSTKNPAFWQHMVTLGIGLGVTGNVGVKQAFDAIDSQLNITWGTPSTKGEAVNIDDLLHAAVNSRGSFFSAQNPEEFVSGLKASLAEIASRVGAGSALAASSSQLQAGTTLYNASYRSGDWSGSLSAWALDSASGDLTSRIWTSSVPAYQNRALYTAVKGKQGISGKVFELASALDVEMQTALADAYPGTATLQALVNYLRGDQSQEQLAGGAFRNRTNGLLGDIVHTTPVFVGAPDISRYKYTGWPEANSHATFATAQANRTKMVYVSANDGMVHGFVADNSAADKGKEVFGFIPRAAVLNGLSSLADPDYNHRYFNDGPLVVQDVYINKKWRTIMIGTTGRAGSNTNSQTGKSIFALDITAPSSLGASSLMWEISHDDIGQITAPPVISRLDDGEWYAIFGNGYNSVNGKAALIRVKLSDGSVTVMKGASAATPNGLAGPLVWDLNEDGSADTAYAGDLAGNVYKFDLVKATAPEIIFVAQDSSGKRQSITAGMTGAEDNKGSTWIHFGTGQYFTLADMANRDTQSWYGLKAEEVSNQTKRAELRERTITSGSARGDYTARLVSEAEENDMIGVKGWYIDFNDNKAPGERIVLPSQIRGDVLIGYTIIPIADACNPGGDGFVMAVDPFSGARLDRIYFDFNGDGEFNSADQVNGKSPSGFSVGRIPSSGVFVDDDLHFNTDSAVSGKVSTNPGSGGGATERISWREILE